MAVGNERKMEREKIELKFHSTFVIIRPYHIVNFVFLSSSRSDYLSQGFRVMDAYV